MIGKGRPRDEAVEERRNAILEAVVARGVVSLDELAAQLGVSRMTAHRDLDALTARGLVRKERGAAAAASSLLLESNFHYRRLQEQATKQTLAAAALRFIEPGQVVMIDDSTTTLQMAAGLRRIEPLTVVTNSLPLLQLLHDSPQIDLIGIGGHYSATFQAFFGLGCETAISQMRADLAFLSTSAVRLRTLYHQSEEVVRAKRAMMTSAERSVLLADHTKFGRTALNRFCELADFHCILVDSAIDPEQLRFLRDSGLPVTVANANPSAGRPLVGAGRDRPAASDA